MTSVPKPLKFLSPHYKKIVEIYEVQVDSEYKVSIARKRLYLHSDSISSVCINQILIEKIRRFCFGAWNGRFGR